MKAALLLLWLMWPCISVGVHTTRRATDATAYNTQFQLVVLHGDCNSQTHARVTVKIAFKSNLRTGKRKINSNAEVLQYSLSYISAQQVVTLMSHQTAELSPDSRTQRDTLGDNAEDSFVLCLSRGPAFSMVLHLFATTDTANKGDSGGVTGGTVCGQYYAALEQKLAITPTMLEECDPTPVSSSSSSKYTKDERHLAGLARQSSAENWHPAVPASPALQTPQSKGKTASIWNLYHLLDDTLSETPAPSLAPTMTPTAKPTKRPKPSAQPTHVPTSIPTSIPTSYPTSVPTPPPTSIPTAIPTSYPSPEPTSVPTAVPTHGCDPTAEPTEQPSSQPTSQPSIPTSQPTSQPSAPTSQPSSRPTSPTVKPTARPTPVPTFTPAPTRTPTKQPTPVPTCSPSTLVPTVQPSTQAPSQPTVLPTEEPTASPTVSPTDPTASPTILPTLQPSHAHLNGTAGNSTSLGGSAAAFIQTSAGIGTVVGAGTAGVATVASASYYLLRASRELIKVPLAPASMAMQI